MSEPPGAGRLRVFHRGVALVTGGASGIGAALGREPPGAAGPVAAGPTGRDILAALCCGSG